jgi:glycosyltransferase involved in cell wall biosynthesis
MVEGLAQAGLEVHIATTDDHGPDQHLEVPLAQPLVQQGVTYWYFRRQTRFYTASWPLTRWLAKHTGEYDLVHIHALFSYVGVPAAYYAHKKKIPYIIRPLGTLNRWGMQQRRPWFKKLSFMLVERRMLTHAALVHFTSEQERQQAEQLGISAPTEVIPLGLDMRPYQQLPPVGQFRAQYPSLAGRTIFLCMARLDPIKGFDLLLPAFARVRQIRDDVALIIAGHGPSDFEAELRTQAQMLGIAQDVVFTGFLTGEQKLAAMIDSDIFVQPSYYESFGMAVVEAMACGLPVAVSDQVGVAHEVAQARAGLVVSCNVDLLSSAMLRLADDAAVWREMGYKGRQLANDCYSLQATTVRLVEVYNELLSHSHSNI